MQIWTLARCNRTRARPGALHDHTIWLCCGPDISGPQQDVGKDYGRALVLRHRYFCFYGERASGLVFEKKVVLVSFDVAPLASKPPVSPYDVVPVHRTRKAHLRVVEIRVFQSAPTN